ncbi:MAG: ribonuclease P protein component [Moraxellaceae bacterium]|nr:ribonuclease P protein component [Pseudobdellovibrionaceae bacterium]
MSCCCWWKITKIYSLKKSSDFLFISKSGKRIKPVKWLTIQYVYAESSSSYVGVTASRKVGPAVLRNKLKRWVRNSVRSIEFNEKISNFGRKIVFVFRPQTVDFYDQLTYAEFHDVLKVLQNI